MAGVEPFFAKNGIVKIDAAGDVTLAANAVLDTAFSSGTAIEGQFKDISFNPGTGDVELINYLGTSSSFQNQALDEKPPGLTEISGTLVLPKNELIESEIFGAGTAAGGTHTTYQTGLATRTKVAMLLNIDDGTNEVNIAATNVIVTEYSVSVASDSHFEVAFTGKCLAADTFGPQFKD